MRARAPRFRDCCPPSRVAAQPRVTFALLFGHAAEFVAPARLFRPRLRHCRNGRATHRGTEAGGLRKDYAYLFQRFFYFLQDIGDEQGIVVFDELEKSQSHLLIDQMRRYFGETAVGRSRATRIISEPFFVHSDLTTGVQIADLVAYVISWGFRLGQMAKPARLELSGLADQIAGLRHLAVRDLNGNPNFQVWSFAHITNLRTLPERLND